MNTITNHISTVVILIVSMILAWLLVINGSAKSIEIDKGRFSNSSEVVTDDIVDFCIRSSCRRYLNENGLLSTSVTPDEFDRYFTMVEQNCNDDGHVYPALILAVIAVESNFDTSAYSSAGARGLMQLIPLYHTSSLSQFKGSPASRDDFFVPEWNIGCGTAYLSELIEQSLTYKKVGDPVGFALMCYNQGMASASSSYFGNNCQLSKYAEKVLSVADDIQDILSKGDVYRAQT